MQHVQSIGECVPINRIPTQRVGDILSNPGCPWSELISLDCLVTFVWKNRMDQDRDMKEYT